MLPVMEIVLPSMGSSSVPAFLAKLWKMVSDEDIDSLISWSDEGNSFIIHNQGEFASRLLPYYYKHSNMASFVRQLNMYGFHKVLGLDSGALKSERGEEMEFAHPFFLKHQIHLLEQIKRKISAGKNSGAVPLTSNLVSNFKSEAVSEVLAEVSLLKDKQDDIEDRLGAMKKENEALWREVVSLRQKHQSQQKIVNKLIKFLVSFVQPRNGTAVKRRAAVQLAIEGEGSSKELKLDEGEDFTRVSDISPMEPIDPLLVNPSIQSPYHSLISRPSLSRDVSRDEFDSDMTTMQKDLDNLKDVLSGQVTLDTSFISNLFNPEEPLFPLLYPLDDSSFDSFSLEPKSKLFLRANEEILDEDVENDSCQIIVDEENEEPINKYSPTSELHTPSVIFSDEDPLLSELNKN